MLKILPIIFSTVKPNGNYLKKIIFSIPFLVISGVSWADCDPLIIHALKTEYKFEESSSLAESLYSIVCESSFSRDSGSLTMPDVVNLSYGGKSIAKACESGSRNFFASNSRNIAYSYLPDQVAEALSSCFHNGEVRLKVKQTQNEIVVQARYIDMSSNNPSPAKVQGLNYDKNALKCSEPATKIGPAGIKFRCERREGYLDKPFFIILKTDRGDASLTVDEREYVPFQYIQIGREYLKRDSTGVLSGYCNLNDRFVGNGLPCKANLCGNPNLFSHYCEATLGYGVVYGPGKSTLVKHRWASDQVPKKAISCIRDDKRLEDIPCKGSYCRYKENRIALCSERYGAEIDSFTNNL